MADRAGQNSFSSWQPFLTSVYTYSLETLFHLQLWCQNPQGIFDWLAMGDSSCTSYAILFCSGHIWNQFLLCNFIQNLTVITSTSETSQKGKLTRSCPVTCVLTHLSANSMTQMRNLLEHARRSCGFMLFAWGLWNHKPMNGLQWDKYSIFSCQIQIYPIFFIALFNWKQLPFCSTQPYENLKDKPHFFIWIHCQIYLKIKCSITIMLSLLLVFVSLKC